MSCPFCGKADNPARARFCSHCGTALLPSRSAMAGQPNDQPASLGEPIEPAPGGEAAGRSDPPGWSRHGFYAGQTSHLDQAGQADDARREEESQPDAGHFDERYGTGGRFVSREAAPLAPVDAPAPPEPEPEPEPARSPAITPEMVFWFGRKDPDPPVPVDVPPPVESRPTPARTAGAPEPDPVSRSFGTWETPDAPPPIPASARPARAAEAGRSEIDGVAAGAEDGPTVAPPVAAATETRERTDVGPAGPVGPTTAPADLGERSGAPVTKQSRYWATGAHASAFAGAWMGGVPAFIGPLVVWLARKDDDPFAAEHGRNALNFNLSVIVYVLGLIIVSILTFGIGLLVTIPGFIALGLAWFAFTLVGTIKAASSESYKYPLTIRFVR